MNVLEDEYHFVLICPAYRSFRSLYLPRYYCAWPNRQKLYKLLKACDRNLKILTVTIKFCRYLNSAWKLYNELCYIVLLSVCFLSFIYSCLL
jgi:hypothetical protein